LWGPHAKKNSKGLSESSNGKGVKMNKMIEAAKELEKIAEDLIEAPESALIEDDPWMTQDDVREICPACADLMASKGMKKIRASVLLGKSRKTLASRRTAQWEKLPAGWTEASLRSFWDSLVGSVKHKVTKCIEKISETDIDDPAAFCASLADRIEGKGWRSER